MPAILTRDAPPRRPKRHLTLTRRQAGTSSASEEGGPGDRWHDGGRGRGPGRRDGADAAPLRPDRAAVAVRAVGGRVPPVLRVRPGPAAPGAAGPGAGVLPRGRRGTAGRGRPG